MTRSGTRMVLDCLLFLFCFFLPLYMSEVQRVIIRAFMMLVLRDDVYVVRAALLSSYSPAVHVLISLSLLLQLGRFLFQFLPLVLSSPVLKPYLYLQKTNRLCFMPSNHHYIENISYKHHSRSLIRLFISVVTALTFLDSINHKLSVSH